MIISNKYKIIFIHIPKTAGTFVTTLIKKIDKNSVSYPHTRYIDACKIIKNIDDYFIFTVIRNIYDLLISLYEYIKQNPFHNQHNEIKNISFKEYIYKLDKKEIISHINQLDYIEKCKNIFIINYDKNNLNNELYNLFKNKFDINITLPKNINISKRNNNIYYDKDTINIVKKLYKKDIKRFNFKYNNI